MLLCVQIFVHERAPDVQVRVGVVRNSGAAFTGKEPQIFGFTLTGESTDTVKRVLCKPGDIFQLTLDLHRGSNSPQLTLSVNGAPPVACAVKLPSDWGGYVPAVAVRGSSSRTLLSVRDKRPENLLLQDWQSTEISGCNAWDTKGSSSNIKVFKTSNGHGIYNACKDPSAHNETVRAKVGFTSGVSMCHIC